MADNKGTTLAILGIIAVIAVVGLVLLFSGASGNLAFRPYPHVEIDAQKACSVMACAGGGGAVVVGEDDAFWICVCPEHFQEQNIAQWSNQWKGDPMHGEIPFNADTNKYMLKVRKY